MSSHIESIIFTVYFRLVILLKSKEKKDLFLGTLTEINNEANFNTHDENVLRDLVLKNTIINCIV